MDIVKRSIVVKGFGRERYESVEDRGIYGELMADAWNYTFFKT